MNNKVKIFVIFLGYLSFANAQFPVCNPLLVEWFSHPHDCESYIICFHGVQHVLPCAPGLHFSPTEKRCMFPDDAQCHVNYQCPSEDDINNPVFLPDPYDCAIYYLCSRGTPIMRECAPGLWWDVVFNWCNTWDDVVCDNRTIINPGNPGDRTTTGAPTTSTTTTTTTTTTPTTTTTTTPTTTTTTTPTTTTTTTPATTTTQRPGIESCHMRQDLFDGDTYIKSLCIVNANVNYETARQRCVSIGMNLFIIDDTRTQTPFFEATTRLLAAHVGGFVWINGRRDNVAGWQVFNSDNTLRGPLYSGIDWVNTTNINGPTSGDCLRYSSQHGPYQAMGVPCTSTSWLTCEHFMQTEDPPTVTTPPTSGPNVTACFRRDDLFHNGNYLKSSCIINSSQNYANAEELCRRNGMELFVIDSSQTQIQFRNSTRQLLINSPRGFVWINGRVDDSCRNWFTFSPDRNPMFPGLHWVQTDDFVGSNTGDCLRYSQQYTDDYFAMGVSCTSSSWLICEFSMPPVADEHY